VGNHILLPTRRVRRGLVLVTERSDDLADQGIALKVVRLNKLDEYLFKSDRHIIGPVLLPKLWPHNLHVKAELAIL
jgi:hypothetical protein